MGLPSRANRFSGIARQEDECAFAFSRKDRHAAAPLSPSSPQTLAVSRAINLDATVQAVASFCTKNGIGVSTIEPLDSGGTRVVLLTTDGAGEVRRGMKRHILEGPTVRSGLYLARHPLPTSRY